MERCGTCRFFEVHKPPHVPHSCVNPKLRQENVFNLAYEDERFIPPSPQFGCTLHEPHPTHG